MLRLLSNALLILRKEGWKLNEVLHGSVRMSQDLEARNLRLNQPETGAPLTSALAFGVLPEIRIASRRSSSTLDRLKVRHSCFIINLCDLLCMSGAGSGCEQDVLGSTAVCQYTGGTAMYSAAVCMLVVHGIL